MMEPSRGDRYTMDVKKWKRSVDTLNKKAIGSAGWTEGFSIYTSPMPE